MEGRDRGLIYVSITTSAWYDAKKPQRLLIASFALTPFLLYKSSPKRETLM
jgi:hypothetical protein